MSLATASMIRGYLYAAMSIALVTLAQLSMKYGMSQLPMDWQWLAQLGHYRDHLNAMLWVVLGLSAYVGSMAAWLGVLANMSLSRAYPLLALSYVSVFVISCWMEVFDNHFDWLPMLGIGLIVVGVYLTNSQQKGS
ncbi:4-amino-4-deoxy-L-arabinose-phosphoundecaprenol flippase subunit ArnF [Paraferrimonas haliotis]|uniref:4-amino-4-deoxy-L-arabinose-phosphoundecaprenol flippase subunit ArnF n=1 Tax=Paraferrimonas haliotis TaxID=2013866 RepID=A0AA37WXA8_9GAMM|nr:4-amino-4-deoxy-L-arabinose-phosphoundecaprenol flippase subunit ArnF [Paraferrimonas haliotis]GLS82310.1 putative 4-amino-4-deoxy-L-arabinose-phosphoundecaprenol flippase subunit ArnF [Paraferrimonas haliotis]